MANSAVSYHVRSNSLPSASHPLLSQFQDNLCRLRSSSEATSTSSSLLSQRLNGLEDLHDCVDQLLSLPSTQRDSVDALLDGSLRLLDVCSIIKDALSQTKESIQEIQSVMRRRCDAQSEAKKFISTRKMAKKTIQKALKTLKDMAGKCSSEDEIVALLREAQFLTVLTLESLLSFINGKKSSSRSLVSKITHTKRVSCEDEEENEFATADVAVQSLIGQKGNAREVKTQMMKLDMCIQDFEDGLESLYRRLIKTRVSLLNTVNH